jgi:hypothetical protein
MQSWRTERPGCGGFFIAILFLLVIIDQIHVVGVTVLKAEDDSPISRHRNGPEAFKIPLQAMKLKTGERHVLNDPRLIQASQNTPNLIEVRCGKPAAVILFIKRL